MKSILEFLVNNQIERKAPVAFSVDELKDGTYFKIKSHGDMWDGECLFGIAVGVKPEVVSYNKSISEAPAYVIISYPINGKSTVSVSGMFGIAEGNTFETLTKEEMDLLDTLYKEGIKRGLIEPHNTDKTFYRARTQKLANQRQIGSYKNGILKLK